MKRRVALQVLGAVLAGCGGGGGNTAEGAPSDSSSNGASGNTTRQKQAIVIGAGFAGLAAAKHLVSSGYQVTVLEARQRIGGRIWTSSVWSDMPVDLGASWIHGVNGNPLTELAQAANAPRLTTSFDASIAYNTDGQPVTSAQTSKLNSLRSQINAGLARGQNANSDQSVLATVEALKLNSANSDETRRFIDFTLASSFEAEYAGSVSQLSTYWFDAAKSYGGDDQLFPQGYAALITYLVQNLTVQTGQVVTSIEWGQAPVRVVTTTGIFQADQVVVTVPLGVLKAGSISFSPALPAAKQQAIAGLGMGLLNKCYLRFDRVFWPNDIDWLEYIPSSFGAWPQWVSLARVAKAPVLMGFLAADFAASMEAKTDTEVVASAMQTLRTIFGNSIPDPISSQLTRWASDPYARGSYSFNLLGCDPAMRTSLAQGESGRLYFAGEACSSEHFSSAHGAYMSGVAVAQKVVAGSS